VAVTGEASQGYDPGPPNATAQVQGGKSWNLHMGLTALRSTESTERWHHLPYRAQAPVIPYHKNQIQMTSVCLTELKKVEEELRESECRYRAVVEQAAEGIVLFDVDSKRVLEANVACQNLLGNTPEAILRLTPYDLGPYSWEHSTNSPYLCEFTRVTDGTRTRALRSHNPLSSVSRGCRALQNWLI
jgi:PAS domain-containing protein